jgi:O-6-methylguanine DNA methyltransferase
LLGEHYVVDIFRDEKRFKRLAKKFKHYFVGSKVFFDEALDVEGATPFELRVWDTVYHIPYGEVRSYSWVAHKIERPREVRAVGQALKRNRLPIIIPCHRVVSKTGDLGGYAGGVELKHDLLRIEGRLW